MEAGARCGECNKAAKLYCTQCKTHICYRHADNHEDHKLCNPDEVAPRVEKIDKLVVDESEAPIETRLDAFSRRVFDCQYDIAQHYKLYKWILKREETEQLIQEVSQMVKEVKVVGVYGCISNCLQFIGNILKLGRAPEMLSEDSREGIVAYCRPDVGLLCFLFKAEDDAVYESKPYPKCSREAIYLRLLFDICPIVVCCPSETVQRNWYWSDEPTLKNPFMPRIHKGMTVKIERKTLRSSEIENVTVRNMVQYESELNMTPDHLPYLFTSTITKKDTTSSCSFALEKLKAWLNNRKSMIENPKERSFFSFSWSSSSSNADFEGGDFQAFSSALRSALENSNKILNTVKESFNDLKSQLESQLKKMTQDHMTQFQSAFRETYEVKEERTSKWLRKTLTLAEFEKKLIETLVESRDLNQMSSLVEELKHFVQSFAREGADSKERARKSVEQFIQEKVAAMTKETENCISQLFTELEDELKATILSLVSTTAVNIFAFRTCRITFEDETLAINSTSIENRYNLQTYPAGKQFLALDKDAAFVYFESLSSFQAVKFNPNTNYSYDIQSLPHLKSSVLIASGSRLNFFVAFSNEEKQAYYGAAAEMKGIDHGIPIIVYGDIVTEVISACILQKSKRTVLLNEKGHVFYIELESGEKRLNSVMVEYRKERTSSEGEIIDPEKVILPLAPANGTQFYDVKSSDDETLYFLLTDTAIEIYDLNFMLSKQITVASPRVQFKVMSNGPFNFVLVKNGQYEFQAYRFQSETEKVESTVEETKQEVIPGNPIIDIIYFAFFKFGNKNHFTSTKPRLFLYSTTREMEAKTEGYIQNIDFLNRSLQFKGSILPSDMPQLLKELGKFPMNLEDLKWRLFTRAPLHLSSIKDGNMIPLQDGFNNFEAFINQIGDTKTDFTTAFLSYIKLGSLELIIKEAKNIKMISVIGRQSSGKSYLLNRIFGTRFDVAAHRCTDGIWLSVSKVKNQTFLVLDCEGLFSVERTVQEEIKLCLLLAAISDVTILNQDLTFNRNLAYLFEKFTYGIDRLKGSKLFKGRLEIAIRDVAANQDDGANAQVRSFVENMINSNKADFLMKLFGGVFMCYSYHNFENEDLFEAAVASRRQFYIDNVSSRWESGEDFLITLKTVMAQIFADDSTSIDSKTFQLKLGRVAATIKKAIDFPATIQELVSPANPPITVSVSILGQEYSFCMDLFDVTVDLSSKYLVFDDFLIKYVSADLRKFNHNEWYEALEQFMKVYFAVYKSTIFKYFEQAISVSDEFRSIYEGEVNVLEKQFEHVILISHSLCMRKCKNCDLICLKPQNHSENCDCSTTHKCMHECDICKPPDLCSLHAGHTGQHLCSSKPHICGKLCKLRGCKGTCIGAPNHPDAHRCSELAHPCGEPCELFEMCNRTCEIDQVVPHVHHHCGRTDCPYPCFNCRKEGSSSTCMTQDHLHCLSDSPEEIYSKNSHELLHFCSKTHNCREKCQAKGVCYLQSHTDKNKVWSNGFTTFNYTYVSQTPIPKPCVQQIPVKSLEHLGEHRCNATHTCGNTCPDCGAYCELVYGHSGVHSTASHRNKEKCIYLAKSLGIEIELKEESKTTTKILKAGDSATPEFCIQSCSRKGRGHTHPMECKGGSSCLQLHPEVRAIHSKDKLYADLERMYDLVDCDSYWKLKKWEPPVQKVSPSDQALYKLCPYYCASTEHAEPVYCEREIFHPNSTSTKFKDHTFSSCRHSNGDDYDIAFILDCTGSMDSSFPEVKRIITEIIDKYQGTRVSAHFAIVGYTDHEPHNGDFPTNPPVKIYPSNKQLRDFNKAAAVEFLDSLKTSGGGPKLGEAMLDGMNSANELGWRPGASRMCIIISDDTPHGDTFVDGTFYPKGCPCNLDWRKLLLTMKENKTEVKLVKLREILNITENLFRGVYGEGFEAMDLRVMSDISFKIVQSIVSVIDHNLEYAKD